MATLKDILIEWQNNPSFRESFKKDPEKALKEKGLIVSPEDLEKIKAKLKLDPSTNEKLDDRTNK